MLTTPKADPAGPLLRITDLHTEVTRAGRTSYAVRGVDLEVAAGQAVGIVGESGCGKTMTALSILQLLPPGGRITGGRIEFDGQDLARADHRLMSTIRGNQIGMVFQDPMTSLNPTMTVGRQIAEVLVRHGDSGWAQARQRAVELLDLVRMPQPAARADRFPHQLSGGQRQRVMIAMAIARSPRLLIADEPTTALDVTVQKQILDLLDELRRELGMALVLVTHDLGVVAGRVDTVVAMYAGKVVERARTQQIFAGARHPYLAALLGSMPERANDLGAVIPTIPGMPPDLARPPVGCAFAARCRFVTEQCTEQAPPVVTAVPGHEVACFHPLGPDHEALAMIPRAPRPADPAAPAVLKVHGVSKRFRSGGALRRQRPDATVVAVDDVSLTIGKGETYGLVGESGCGKTTLGRMIVGLERPDSGRILLQGRDSAQLHGKELRSRRRIVQLVFQDSYAALDPRMTVSAILEEPMRIQRTLRAAQRSHRVNRLLDDVGLPAAAAQRYPHEFSGGQRQRIGIARALALDPTLIVADEPVSALDVSVQAQILDLLAGLQREYQLSYLLISHDLEVVRYLADRIGVMYRGRIVEEGSSAAVYENPQHEYTRLLFGSAPTLKADRRRLPAPRGVEI